MEMDEALGAPQPPKNPRKSPKSIFQNVAVKTPFSPNF